MKYVIPFMTALILSACSSQNTEINADSAPVDSTKAGWFGEQFAYTDVVPAAQVVSLMNDSSSNEFVVEGTIQECCQKKGCWMKVDMGNGEFMRVSFKDYGFFVPLDAAGRTMVMKGVASFDTLDVDYLKHLAEDAKKTQAEIDSITKPELALTFEATGVLIK